ncbi:MAG: hypothetical protein ACRCX5_12225 [Bacteroidales bacterium]
MKNGTVTISLYDYERLKHKERIADEREKELLETIEGLKSGAKAIVHEKIYRYLNAVYIDTRHISTNFLNCEELEKELRTKIEKEITEEKLYKHPEFKKLKDDISFYKEALHDCKEENYDIIRKVKYHNSKWYNFNKIKL